MSRCGELALRRVVIEYNQVTGVGASMRQALAREVPAFKAKYPSVVIDIRPRDDGATRIAGVYRDGSTRAYNAHAFGAQGIGIRLHKLANTANDIEERFGAKHIHRRTSSVQGNWNPWLWIAERHHNRIEQPSWDRKLTEKEWDYYVDKYGAEMLGFEEAVQKKLDNTESVHREHTQQVAQRWNKHVKPFMQTDVEENLMHSAKQAAKLKFPEPVKFGEYSLFAMPDTNDLGIDAVQALRAKELKKEEQWWKARERQLKPPA
jgi:hypothetical protein